MRFLPIESRNAPMGRPLPPPHALALDGALFADPAARFANLHFIRTEGVEGEARKRCVEVRAFDSEMETALKANAARPPAA